MLVTFITMFTDISEYIIALSYLDTKYKYKNLSSSQQKTDNIRILTRSDIEDSGKKTSFRLYLLCLNSYQYMYIFVLEC